MGWWFLVKGRWRYYIVNSQWFSTYSELLWTSQLDIACGVVTQKDGTRSIINLWWWRWGRKSWQSVMTIMKHMMIMKTISMMKLMTMIGGWCTSRGTMVDASFTGISPITMGHHHHHHIYGRDDGGDHHHCHRHHHHQINLNYQVAPCEHLKAWLPAAAYEHDFTQVFEYYRQTIISTKYLN